MQKNTRLYSVYTVDTHSPRELRGLSAIDADAAARYVREAITSCSTLLIGVWPFKGDADDAARIKQLGLPPD